MLNQDMAHGPELGWYINEWLALNSLNQKEFAQITGWSKQKVSAICNGRNRYNKETVETAAAVLGCHPYELLLHPTRAIAIRRLLEDKA